MLLNDKQSLILCAILIIGLFVAGVFDVLDNSIVFAILAIIFCLIIANIIYVKSKINIDVENDSKQKKPS